MCRCRDDREQWRFPVRGSDRRDWASPSSRRLIAGESIRRGELVPALTNYQWPVSPAYAVYPPTRHLSRRAREFIDFLAEYFSGTPSWDEDCALPVKA